MKILQFVSGWFRCAACRAFSRPDKANCQHCGAKTRDRKEKRR